MIVNAETLQSLEITYSAVFKGAFDAKGGDSDPLVMKVPSATKRNYYAWLGKLPRMREWLGDRVIHDLNMHDFNIVNKKFEVTLKLERDEIEDDTFGTFSDAVGELGEQAALHPDQQIFAFLAASRAATTNGYDGVPLVSTIHPHEDLGTVSNDQGGAGTAWWLADLGRRVKPMIWQTRRPYQFRALDDITSERAFMKEEYLYGVDARVAVGSGVWQTVYGSQQTLDATNFGNAIEAMMSLTNDVGDPMRVMPTHLIVPPSLRAEARALIEAERLASGASNTNFKEVQLLITPWLA